MEDAEAGVEEFDLDDFKVPLKEWIQQEQPRIEIRRRFRQFLDHFEDGETRERVHDKVIDKMCAEGGQSLTISYLNLSRFAPTLAIWLADEPLPMLELFDAVAKTVVAARFPDWYNPVKVRVSELPIPDSLRDLRQVHLGVLVRVQGVVTRRTGVMPQLSIVRFNCNVCGTLSEPMQQTGSTEARMVSCPVCPPESGRASGTVNSEATLYRNFQRLTLQESPGSVPAGRVPRSKEVILAGDLVDCARPGEEVDITGIYTHQFDASLNARNGFPVFGTVIEANYVKRLSDNSAHLNITEQDRAEFDKLSRDPSIVRRLVRSLAPSIYGNDRAKLAVALAMFGGREKNVKNKHRIRGDINVLLLGDPGVAKSQILKYVEKTATRCVYTTGKGASAVGLTAAVSKDPITGEWTLEGGALVLADRGVCCIECVGFFVPALRVLCTPPSPTPRLNTSASLRHPPPPPPSTLPSEFDKMTDQDRTSIHEAMEQQSISISKAGIVTTLQARCAVVAAANPIGGRYDSSKTFSENVQLTDPILTRFDVLCVLRDEVDPVLDGKLAEFVVRSHVRSHPEIKAAMEAMAGLKEDEVFQVAPGMQPILTAAQESMAMSSLDEGAGAVGGDGSALEPIPQDLLRKYIVHARALKPSLTNIDQEKVASLYMSLRKESEVSNGVPVAVRHIESIMRISEAAARMRLSSMVSDSDLNLAIRTTMESFIAAQKAGVQVRGWGGGASLRVRFHLAEGQASPHPFFFSHLPSSHLRSAPCATSSSATFKRTPTTMCCCWPSCGSWCGASWRGTRAWAWSQRAAGAWRSAKRSSWMPRARMASQRWMTSCAAPCFSPRAFSGMPPPQRSCATRARAGVCFGSLQLGVGRWGATSEGETTCCFVSQWARLKKKKRVPRTQIVVCTKNAKHEKMADLPPITKSAPLRHLPWGEDAGGGCRYAPTPLAGDAAADRRAAAAAEGPELAACEATRVSCAIICCSCTLPASTWLCASRSWLCRLRTCACRLAREALAFCAAASASMACDSCSRSCPLTLSTCPKASRRTCKRWGKEYCECAGSVWGGGGGGGRGGREVTGDACTLPQPPSARARAHL